MKKSLLGILVIAQQAMATSPVPVLVQYKQVAAGSAITMNLKSLVVQQTGKIIGTMKTQSGTTLVYQGQLSTHALDAIVEQVKDAESAPVRPVAPGIACFTSSPFLHSYTANNGAVTLYKGHPCNGALQVNQSDAAKALVKTLRDLTKKAFGSFPTVEAE